MVQHMIPEPSTIQALSVEGSRLDTEPSAILTFSVEGSTLEPRTVREMGHQHGRLGLGEWNRPRYQPSAWRVQHMDPEPSTISAPTVEGSTPDTRTIRDTGH